MKRLDDGEGSSPQVGTRLSQKTAERLDELVAGLPPHPVAGTYSRAMVLRAVIEAGIEALAIQERVKLGAGAAPKPIHRKVQKAKSAKTPSDGAKTFDGKTVHRASRARAERRAEARRLAGCTCKGKHVPTCKLYHQPLAKAG